MTSALTLGTPLPLIQAPMAGAQGSALAISAGSAGALGSIPAAMLDAARLHDELARMRDAGRPFNVNFFAHTQPAVDPAAEAAWRAALAPYYAQWGIDAASVPAGAGRRPFDAEFAEVLEPFRPAVVSFHFGLPPAPLLARVKAMGSLVLSSATTLDEALWLQQNGVDAVIAQGLQAGGHRGHFLSTDVALQAPTLDLLRQFQGRLAVPVIAAGGIVDAAGIRAALAAGAAAVQLGTVFLLCTESLVGPLHRARLKDAAAPTALTNLFTGGLARGLFNRAMRDLGPASALAPAFPLATAAVAPLRARAEAAGLDDFTPLWSGTDRSACKEVPASEVVHSLAAAFTA